MSRSAYSERVKAILLDSLSDKVAKEIAENLKEFSAESLSDEVKWLDVQIHATKILNGIGKILFIPSEEIMMRPDLIADAKSEGYEVVVIPDNLSTRIDGITDFSGSRITNSEVFYEECNEGFKFKFIEKK